MSSVFYLYALKLLIFFHLHAKLSKHKSGTVSPGGSKPIPPYQNQENPQYFL
jgi:hypothetical protein